MNRTWADQTYRVNNGQMCEHSQKRHIKCHIDLTSFVYTEIYYSCLETKRIKAPALAIFEKSALS